jgi:hypothetical protein
MARCVLHFSVGKPCASSGVGSHTRGEHHQIWCRLFGSHQRNVRQMDSEHEVFLFGCEERRFGDRDSSRQCEHRQWSKKQQIKGQGFLLTRQTLRPLRSNRRKSFRPVQTHLTSKESLRFAGSRKPKNSLLPIMARDQPPEASTARWPSIARTTG